MDVFVWLSGSARPLSWFPLLNKRRAAKRLQTSSVSFMAEIKTLFCSHLNTPCCSSWLKEGFSHLLASELIEALICLNLKLLSACRTTGKKNHWKKPALSTVRIHIIWRVNYQVPELFTFQFMKWLLTETTESVHKTWEQPDWWTSAVFYFNENKTLKQHQFSSLLLTMVPGDGTRGWYYTMVPRAGTRGWYQTMVLRAGTRHGYPMMVPEDGTRGWYWTMAPALVPKGSASWWYPGMVPEAGTQGWYWTMVPGSGTQPMVPEDDSQIFIRFVFSTLFVNISYPQSELDFSLKQRP